MNMSKIEQTNEEGAYRNQYVWDLQDKVIALEKALREFPENIKLECQCEDGGIDDDAFDSYTDFYINRALAKG